MSDIPSLTPEEEAILVKDNENDWPSLKARQIAEKIKTHKISDSLVHTLLDPDYRKSYRSMEGEVFRKARSQLVQNPAYAHLIKAVINNFPQHFFSLSSDALDNPALSKDQFDHLVNSSTGEYTQGYGQKTVNVAKVFEHPFAQDPEVLNDLYGKLVKTGQGRAPLETANKLTPENAYDLFVNQNLTSEGRADFAEKHPEVVHRVIGDMVKQAALNPAAPPRKLRQAFDDLISPGLEHVFLPEAQKQFFAQNTMPYALENLHNHQISRNVKWSPESQDYMVDKHPGLLAAAKHATPQHLDKLTQRNDWVAAQAAGRISRNKTMEVYDRLRNDPKFADNEFGLNEIVREITQSPHLESQDIHRLMDENPTHTFRLTDHPKFDKDHSLRLFNAESEPGNLLHLPIDERHVGKFLTGHMFLPDFHDKYGSKLLDRLVSVANDDQFRRLKTAYPVSQHPELDRARNADNSGSHIGVTIGSNRLRLARMHAKNNNGVINEKQLKDLGIDLRTQGHAHVFDGKGNTDVAKLSQRIDSLPKLQYKYSHGYYDGPHQRHDDHLEDEDGHPNQDVFQLHMTPGQKRQMLAEGVYHEYKDLHDKIVRSGVHPVAADDGIGWVRYTKGDDGIPHIDELQSDYSQTNGHVQGAKWDKIKKILWQGKAPTTVLHEAFHQHLRDSGKVGEAGTLKNVMFTAEAKHKNPDLSGLDPTLPLTHHHQNTYGDTPGKMGYAEVKGGYGPHSAETQSNPKYNGVPTQEIHIAKSEKIPGLVTKDPILNVFKKKANDEADAKLIASTAVVPQKVIDKVFQKRYLGLFPHTVAAIISKPRFTSEQIENFITSGWPEVNNIEGGHHPINSALAGNPNLPLNRVSWLVKKIKAKNTHTGNDNALTKLSQREDMTPELLASLIPPANWPSPKLDVAIKQKLESGSPEYHRAIGDYLVNDKQSTRLSDFGIQLQPHQIDNAINKGMGKEHFGYYDSERFLNSQAHNMSQSQLDRIQAVWPDLPASVLHKMPVEKIKSFLSNPDLEHVKFKRVKPGFEKIIHHPGLTSEDLKQISVAIPDTAPLAMTSPNAPPELQKELWNKMDSEEKGRASAKVPEEYSKDFIANHLTDKMFSNIYDGVGDTLNRHDIADFIKQKAEDHSSVLGQYLHHNPATTFNKFPHLLTGDFLKRQAQRVHPDDINLQDHSDEVFSEVYRNGKKPKPYEYRLGVKPDFQRHEGRAMELGLAQPKLLQVRSANKLRQLQLMVENSGGVVSNKQLKATGKDLGSMGLGHLLDNKGNLYASKIEEHINSLPAQTWAHTETVYGEDQRHSKDNSKVFQLNFTPEKYKQLQAAGLGTIFDKIHQGGHPANKRHGAGWVRYTENPDGIHIDEIQSDFGPNLVHQAKQANDSRLDPTQVKNVVDFIWNGQHPSKVLHEAFLEHLRQNGKQGKPIHIWDTEPKAKLSGQDPKKQPPAHMKETYRDQPKDMGYNPGGQYGELSTQSNKKLIGKKTHKMVLKSELMNWVELNNLHKFDRNQYDRDNQHILNRFHTPVKIAMGDFSSLPEFRAAKTLAPHAQFDEDLYREALWRYDDNPVWAAIFAYGLPRTQQTVNDIEQLRRMF